MIDVLVVSFISLLVVGLCYSLWLLADAQRKQSKKQNSRIHLNQANYHDNHKIPTWMQQKLLSLVGGDKKTANRLLASVRRANSNQAKAWCYEKIIYDLERDRGSI